MEQHQPNKPGMTSCVPEGKAIPVPLIIPLYINKIPSDFNAINDILYRALKIKSWKHLSTIRVNFAQIKQFVSHQKAIYT